MFGSFPSPVIDFVLGAFREANTKVSRSLSLHPSMHEESLDHMLLAELSSAPPAFFAEVGAAVEIQTHWLGGRRMYGRWEIADIALLVLFRVNGGLTHRKVALLQTKRLYTKELPTTELEEADYIIGIGRLGDQVEMRYPLVTPRKFSFSDACVFGAMTAGSKQVGRIDAYESETKIPVHYAFYCPVEVPYECEYPSSATGGSELENHLGCRVQSAQAVHQSLKKVVAGKAPSLAELALSLALSEDDKHSEFGWRIEDFVANEVLSCREGKLFDGTDDANLQRLFYERSAPISSAISITIDVVDGRD